MNNLRTPQLSDYVWLVGLALLWSTSFVLIKYAVIEMPPFSMTVLRFFVAVLTMAVCYVFVTVRDKKHGELLRFWQLCKEISPLAAVTAAIGGTIPFSLIAWGGTKVDVGVATTLMGIMPLATLLLAHLTLADERLNLAKTIGIILGFSGIVILSSYDAISGLGDRVLYQLMVLFAAVCYAVNSLLMRKLSSHHQIPTALLLLFFAFIFMLPMAFLKEGWNPEAFAGVSARAWISTITLGILQTALASLVMFRILYYCGAGFFAQINYMIPVLGVLWGAALLGEQLRWNMLIALVFILLGIMVARLGQKMKQKKA